MSRRRSWPVGLDPRQLLRTRQPAGAGDDREGQRRAARLLKPVLRLLTPRQRQVLVLHVGRGLSFASCARLLGITGKSAWRLLQRA